MDKDERPEATRSLDFSFMSVDSQGNMMPRTPQVAIIAVTAYLLSNQPPAGDPRSVVHRSFIAGLDLVEAALVGEPDKEPKKALATRKSNRSPLRDDNLPWCRCSP